MNDTAYALAIDLGTSGPKAAVVSTRGHTIGTARSSVTTIRLADGGVEQDPEEIWAAVRSASKAAIEAADVPADQIISVIVASQYSSIVPVDDEGTAIANMIIWQDQRGSKKKLSRSHGMPKSADSPLDQLRWLRTHGLPPIAGGISMTHMRYFKYARPDVYERTAAFLEPMDYLNLRLTGRVATNQCSALMFLMTDNRRLDTTDYDPALVSASLIDRAKLPEILPMDAVVGTLLPAVADELGLSPSTAVITGLNDTQAGAMGAGAFAGDHAAISIGSTAVMVSHVGFKRTDILNAILSMPSPVPDTYFIMAENGMAGAALERFVSAIVFPDDAFGGSTPTDTAERYAGLQRVVDGVPAGSDGLIFMPWLSGSMAPKADDHMRGGFVNISATTTRAHMARAVLEGIAMNLRWVRDPAEKFAKRTFSHFIVYGGGSRSDALCQIIADTLNAPVHRMADSDYTVCIGAGMLALERLGRVSLADIATSVRTGQVFEPDADRAAVYDALFPHFVKAFNANKPVIKGINKAMARFR